MALFFQNKYPNKNIPIHKLTSSWLLKAIEEENYVLGKLTYTFLTDVDLHKINVEFLDHDTFTDIITFDYNRGNMIIGEIYMSIDRIKENSVKNNVTFAQEFDRILIHGLLHLLGYKDKDPDDKILMTQKEDYYLSLQPQK
ncbi:rRNA maturation RNase YbeY [Lentimicrobium sp. S6]|uniref:rRNA maturation RNase YbeY n=1 Tax=Lentimicrobium sp. S6 TaxID=2735872 RepID=UPI001C13281C|nr:rRNA maturation RNase YbeY [Lentimicrobium sp. S6]